MPNASRSKHPCDIKVSHSGYEVQDEDGSSTATAKLTQGISIALNGQQQESQKNIKRVHFTPEKVMALLRCAWASLICRLSSQIHNCNTLKQSVQKTASQ